MLSKFGISSSRDFPRFPPFFRCKSYFWEEYTWGNPPFGISLLGIWQFIYLGMLKKIPKNPPSTKTPGIFWNPPKIAPLPPFPHHLHRHRRHHLRSRDQWIQWIQWHLVRHALGDFFTHPSFEKNEEDMTENHSQMLNVWYIYLHENPQNYPVL